MAAPASASTKTYESLGTFYLGRRYDLAKSALGTEPVLYDSRDLVTHGVIVGMTGSGKTGLAMNVNLSSTDFDYLDQALAYSDWSWQFTYLMNCKLLNYPDKNAPEGSKLQPEAADFPVVSNGGKTYTFTIKVVDSGNNSDTVTCTIAVSKY